MISFIVCWIIIYFSIWKGIKVSGKIALVTVLAPYFMFSILLIRVLTLPGSFEGIKFLFVPKISQIFKIKTWFAALDQIFFQNNLGFGGIVLFSTFRKRSYKVWKSTKIIVLANFATGIIASVVVFSYLGFFSHMSKIPIEDLPIEGADLIFITYPAALSCLPFPRFWMFIFFLTLIFIGIDTQFAVVEAMGYMMIDFKFKYKDKLISNQILRLFVCLVLFIGFLFLSSRKGFYYLKFINSFIIFIPISFCAYVNYYVFCKIIRSNWKSLVFL